jgi:hypothetical protein
MAEGFGTGGHQPIKRDWKPRVREKVTITDIGNELNERKNQPRVAFVEKDTAA